MTLAARARWSRHVVSAVVLAGVGAIIAACGGKVEGTGAGTSTTSKRPSIDPPAGHGTAPNRPVVAPTAAAVAAQIAEAYCKTFSSCCVSTNQPPIDVSRCREVMAKQLEAVISASGFGDVDAANACVTAVKARTSLCGDEDVAWSEYKNGPALFSPASVRVCADELGLKLGPMGISAQPCRSNAECTTGTAGTTCAIDQCSAMPALGSACPDKYCLDSAICGAGGTCVARPNGDVGAMCTQANDCAAGLVCFDSQCAPTREHPELATDRYSPYRIGADTCKAFTYL